MTIASPSVPPAFDDQYAREQMRLGPKFGAAEVFERYRASQNGSVNPHRSFLAQWYNWQNPGAAAYPSLLDHYLSARPDDQIDPAPWIDTTLFKRQFTDDPDRTAVLDRALLPHWGAEQGVTAGFSDLARVQRAFHDQVEVTIVRPPPPIPARRRRLLWVQHGPNSEFLKWFDPAAPRSWDVMLNWYTGTPDPDVGETILYQAGTKFTGIFAAARTLPDAFAGYEHVFFIDDDLKFAMEDIDRIFDTAEVERLDLFQASLSKGSFCVWPDLFHKGGDGIREMTAIEIMAPGFSAAALKRFVSCFSLSISGFGLDLLAGRIIREIGGRVAVIDAIQMTHDSKIDQSGGAYYEYLRRHGINSKYELWCLMQRYGLEPVIAETERPER